MEVEVALSSQDLLGEGPVWDEDEDALYWVDIKRKLLRRWELKTNYLQIWELPSEIGSFALRESGGSIVALRTGFAYFDFNDGDLTPFCDPESEMPTTRFNDGKCDRLGRFWAGTMDENESNKIAALYRLDPDGHCQKMRANVVVSNGLGWSPDDMIFYFTDSRTRSIYAYDFCLETGEIDNERIFVQTPKEIIPDGLTVDAEGFIWSVKWDGWKVVRYTPDGGIEREIPLPVQRPTSCTFGGSDLNQLFITSARTGLSERELEQQPNAGDIFVLNTDVSGIPTPKFAG